MVNEQKCLVCKNAASSPNNRCFPAPSKAAGSIRLGLNGRRAGTARRRRAELVRGAACARHRAVSGAAAAALLLAWKFHQVAPVHPRSVSESRGGRLHLAQATLDGRGYAGLRGARAATSLKRSPMPTGIGCAPTQEPLRSG